MVALRPKIVLPGGSGFLGRVLANWFDPARFDVVVLTRRPQDFSGPGRAVAWDGRLLGDWWHELDGALAVVNLAGRSVNSRYHARNRALMLHSRAEPTRLIGEAISRCNVPPRVWLNSSTATIYKHSLDRPMDEATGVIGGTPEVKDEFSIEVATAWERAFDEAVAPQTRKVALRTAMVFSNIPGTVYRVLRRLVRLGLGGPMAGGGQYVSWIHERDFCRAVEWLIERENFSGPVNLAAPRPLTNRAMMHVLRHAYHVPFGLPATRAMLEIGAFLLRTETELIIKSRRVVPRRLSEAGFTFQFNTLAEAITDLEQRSQASRTARIDPKSELVGSR
jgi:hypothetical protein